ncbi:hypothetical protein H696_00961 [Fonticula alba]|uniref:Uncharacterized protein n=1 Tax=Fonticula alba TaxID=691883 RepID=A0A058ZGC9_FONAL|nr:hypothetical protein H696_00961 [Fonticula alba]KCV73424.1 hypothetical protein H696_00961 [Fonticula alba]|eukprot:XP_009493125.1 hypothetical protein H696_00961 [Fonticula alba]
MRSRLVCGRSARHCTYMHTVSLPRPCAHTCIVANILADARTERAHTRTHTHRRPHFPPRMYTHVCLSSCVCMSVCFVCPCVAPRRTLAARPGCAFSPLSRLN